MVLAAEALPRPRTTHSIGSICSLESPAGAAFYTCKHAASRARQHHPRDRRGPCARRLGRYRSRSLHAFLYSSGPKEDRHQQIWSPKILPGESFFRIFLSHTHEHKVEMAALKMALLPYGIAAFVAHEDIEPTEEWEEVIEFGLDTCDALLAYLTPGFIESKWCDQEVGVCIGKGKVIIPVRMEADPHGFLGKYQGAQGVGRDAAGLAAEVARIVRANKRMERKYAEVLVGRLCEAYSYAHARAMFRQVEQIPARLWTPDMIQRARTAAATNGELIDGFVGNSTVAAETIALADALEAGSRT